MLLGFLLPFLIGVMGVLQNTMNRRYAVSMGIPMALVFNGIVLFFGALIFYFGLRFIPAKNIPGLYQASESGFAFGWWLFIPGLLGFLIVAIAPWAIESVGATKVFIGVIVAQIFTSILWDYFVESLPVDPMRAAGAALALAGALLAAR